MNPGWVQTDMGGPNANLTPAEVAERLYRILSRRHRLAFERHRVPAVAEVLARLLVDDDLAVCLVGQIDGGRGPVVLARSMDRPRVANRRERASPGMLEAGEHDLGAHAVTEAVDAHVPAAAAIFRDLSRATALYAGATPEVLDVIG